MSRFDSAERLEEMLSGTEQVAATTYQHGLGVGFSDTRAIREMLALEVRKGWLRGYVLYAGGQPCAFWIGCVYDRTLLSEYLGHDPSYAKHSTGNFLLTNVMEDLWHEGVRTIDFGFGEAQYKQRFGNRHWCESTVCMYASTAAGVRTKALRTMANLINSTGKAILKWLNLAERVKKSWRTRAARANRLTPPVRVMGQR